jgi:hypothetical protein
MDFFHLRQFDKDAARIFTDEDLLAMKEWLEERPTCGDVIPGSGGCRKMRWAAKGHGKRGGARVIYFYRLSASRIVLMRAYAKNEKEDLPQKAIRALREGRFL